MDPADIPQRFDLPWCREGVADPFGEADVPWGSFACERRRWDGIAHLSAALDRSGASLARLEALAGEAVQRAGDDDAGFGWRLAFAALLRLVEAEEARNARLDREHDLRRAAIASGAAPARMPANGAWQDGADVGPDPFAAFVRRLALPFGGIAVAVRQWSLVRFLVLELGERGEVELATIAAGMLRGRGDADERRFRVHVAFAAAFLLTETWGPDAIGLCREVDRLEAMLCEGAPCAARH